MDKPININASKGLDKLAHDLMYVVESGIEYSLSYEEIKEDVIEKLKQHLKIKRED